MARSPSPWIALVIGNSRLHWARGEGGTIDQFWHTPHLSGEAIATLVSHHFDFSVLNSVWGEPDVSPMPAPVPEESPSIALPPEPAFFLASVVPQQTEVWCLHCPQARVVTLEDLPLTDAYPTLGIDRALAAYGCVMQYGTAVLVMDAGTAFTLTGVDATLRLVGGAILPGMGLQLQSLGTCTANLPLLSTASSTPVELPDRWARETELAILSGVVHTLVSGIQDFVKDWCDRYPDSTLVLTGGDRQFIFTALQQVAPRMANQIHLTDTAVLEGLCRWGRLD